MRDTNFESISRIAFWCEEDLGISAGQERTDRVLIKVDARAEVNVFFARKG
jgi:hypothetical protein